MVKLSTREKEISLLLTQGCSNKEIAEKLGIQIRTVKAMFSRLFIRFSIEPIYIKRVRLAVLLYNNRFELGLEELPKVAIKEEQGQVLELTYPGEEYSES